MTHEHLRVLDETLWLLAQRFKEFADVLPPSMVTLHFQGRAKTTELLRASDIGRSLARIIAFAEGEDEDHEQMQAVLDDVLQMLFGETLARTPEYRRPPGLHKTELGRIIYDARVRLIPASQLIRPASVARLFSVSLQTIFDWVEDATLQPEYLQAKTRFDRVQILDFRRRYQPRKRKLTTPDQTP